MSIILSSIKRAIRDKEVIIVTVFLAILLPYLFNMMYSSEDKVENIDLLVKSSEKNKVVEQYIDSIKELDKSNDSVSISIEESNKELGTEDFQRYDLIVDIDDKNKSIVFEASNNLNTTESLIKITTEEYFNSISSYEVLSENNRVLTSIDNSVINTKQYEEKVEEPEFDLPYDQYFSIIMLQMALLTSSILAFKNTFYVNTHLGKRIMSSSMPIKNVVINEMIGTYIAIFGQGIVTLFAIKIVYGVNVNIDNIVGIIIVIGCLSLVAVSMGIFTSSITTNKTLGDNIVSISTLVLTFTSGKFLSHDMSDAIEGISRFNPMSWSTNAIFGLIENNNYDYILETIILTGIYAIIIGIIATVFIKKKGMK